MQFIFIDLTSLFYFVFFVVPLFRNILRCTLQPFGDVHIGDGGCRKSFTTVGLTGLGGTDAVSEELWDRDAEEALVGTGDLEEEKK